MIKRILVILTICFSVFTAVSAADIYVDYQNGNDSNPGTKSAPLKTVSAAKTMANTMKTSVNEDVYVYLKGGRHFVEEELIFEPSDSGKGDNNIVYTSYDGVAQLSGGAVIENWSLDSATGIYSATIPEDLESRHLFVDGVRAIRARDYTEFSSFSAKSTGFTTESSVLYNVKKSPVSEVELVFEYAFCQQRAKVKSVAEKNYVLWKSYDVVMDNDYGTWTSVYNDITGTFSGANAMPVYAENALDFLDEPGEFYIDHTNNVAYYMPRSFEDMSKAEVIIPVRERMITLSGDHTTHEMVKNIRFENLEFAYTTWMQPSEVGFFEVQNNIMSNRGDEIQAWSFTTDASIWMHFADNIDFTDCKFHKLGSGGVMMTRAVDNCDFTGNEFYDISSTALTIGSSNYANEAFHPNGGSIIENITVTNNYFHDLPAEYMGGSMLTVGFPQNVDISNNEFFNAPYTGIHIGMGWSDGWDKGTPTVTKNINISKNSIIDVMNVLHDGGAIYTLGRTGYVEGEEYNTITENYIVGVNHSGGGLYHDEGSNGWLDERNVVDLSTSPKTQSYLSATPENPSWINNHIASGSMPQGVHCILKNNYSATQHMFSDSYGFIMNTEYNVNSVGAKKVIKETGLNETEMNKYEGIHKFSLANDKYTLSIGGKATITVSELTGFKNQPKNQVPVVYYESANEAVATVDGGGTISAVGSGSTEIKVYIKDGTILRERSVNVTVN